MPPRPTPFDLVFAPLADDRFPPIRAALESAGHDPRDRDAFLLTRDAAALVHELRPDAGLAEGIDQLAALVHHAFLFWLSGCKVESLSRPTLDSLLTRPPNPGASTALTASAPSSYTQLPAHVIWASPVATSPPEPLDGWFADFTPEHARILAVFGLHPERMGFTVVEATGDRSVGPARPDGTPLFAPILPGGEAAGLHSIAGAEELLELAWRERERESEAEDRPAGSAGANDRETE
ncbi:MAG TPA: hypothetical protein VFW66_12440 [Gemmatimonadales bacterium]|nr:hypothetical protein [Gemmatimonadales bacterium]